MEARLDHGTPRGDRAGDLLPKGPLGGEGDQGGVRIRPVAVLERLLPGPKRVGVHVTKVARRGPRVKPPNGVFPGSPRSYSGETKSRRGSSTMEEPRERDPPARPYGGGTRPYRYPRSTITLRSAG